jgi:hypothetical protein
LIKTAQSIARHLNVLRETNVLEPLATVQEVVAALGGTSATGRLTNAGASSVCCWKHPRNDKIPPKYYFVIKQALAARGYYADLAMFGFVGDFRQSA